ETVPAAAVMDGGRVAVVAWGACAGYQYAQTENVSPGASATLSRAERGELPMRVFVTGGSGLVGSRLIRALSQRKDEVVLLHRRPEAVQPVLGSSCLIVAGDPTQTGPWMDNAAGCDAVVNLTGENIFNQRWNDAFKQRLVSSRVLSTHNVVQALARKPRT